MGDSSNNPETIAEFWKNQILFKKTAKTDSQNTVTSDDRFKTNEIPITDALSTILKLKPDGTVSFTGTISGITPSNTAHLATKGYVDGSVTLGGSLDYLTISNQVLTRNAIDLATDYEKRIKFQADIQDYVDMSISSTINHYVWRN